MDEKRYRLLTRIAVAFTLAWVLWTLFDSGLVDWRPAAAELDAARKQLEDGHYDEALALYQDAFTTDPDNLGAQRGMAQALMQLGAEAERLAQGEPKGAAREADQALAYYTQAMTHYDQAIRHEEAREPTPLRQRILGVAYANRGILRDRMGDYSGALSDYGESMRLEPEVAEGPGFLIRFMRNQAEKPPTVEDRARYLRAELAKPEHERLLRMPALDARQRAYSMD
jgi:tetratricopeptide (TPR) repeat protein